MAAKKMIRVEIICRRFEAMRMRRSEKVMDLYTREMLVSATPKLLRYGC